MSIKQLRDNIKAYKLKIKNYQNKIKINRKFKILDDVIENKMINNKKNKDYKYDHINNINKNKLLNNKKNNEYKFNILNQVNKNKLNKLKTKDVLIRFKQIQINYDKADMPEYKDAFEQYKNNYIRTHPEEIYETVIKIRGTTDDITPEWIQNQIDNFVDEEQYEYEFYFATSKGKATVQYHNDMKGAGKVNIPTTRMKQVKNINYDWMPDIKVQSEDMCVYDSFKVMPNMPKIFKNENNKLLEYFDKLVNNKVGEKIKYEPLKITDGVSPEMIDKLCRDYNISHYCLDYSKKLILHFTADSKKDNHSPVCYICHDNHMYLITDINFIRKFSNSRTNDKDYKIKMLEKDHDEKTVYTNEIVEDIPLNELKLITKDIIVIYTGITDLIKILWDLLKQDGILYEHKSVDNKIIKIIYKKSVDKRKHIENIILVVDPNYIHKIKIKNEDGIETKLNYKNIKALCEYYKIEFRNQSYGAVIREITIGDFDNKRKRIKRCKEDKKLILERQEYKCNICGCGIILDSKSCQYDHIIPLCINGLDNLENLQALCIECHSEKTKQEIHDGKYIKLNPYSSTFNNECLKIINSPEFRRYAFIERLDDTPVKYKEQYIDIVKCRRNILYNLKTMNIRIPVFSCLDNVEKYEYIKKIKPGFYFINSKNYMPTRGSGWYSHAMIKYCINNNLININDITHQIISSMSLEGDFFNKILDKLLGMPYGLSKYAANNLIGLFNKTKIEVQKLFYSKSFEMASDFYLKNAALKKKMFIEKIEENDIYKVSIDNVLECDFYTNIIYHLILDQEAVELHKLESLIKSGGGIITNYGTDCVGYYTENNEPIKIDGIFWDDKCEVLKYHYEYKTVAPTAMRMPLYKIKNKFELIKRKYNIIEDPMIDDFEPLVNKIINLNESVFISSFAGSGKTYLLKKLIERFKTNNINYLSLSPTNKACVELSKETITIHKFTSTALGNTTALKKKCENLEYIIIDELSMMAECFYSVFLSIKKINPKIKYILSGDFNQIPAIDRCDFDYKNSNALGELCDYNKLILSKCRRSDKELYNESMEIIQTGNVKKSYGCVEQRISLSYTNKKRIEINKEWIKKEAPKNSNKINKNESDPESFEYRIYKGLPLIATKTDEKYGLKNNQCFVVDKVVTKEQVLFIKDGDDNLLKIDIKDVGLLFYPAYCITIHKSQGSTIKEPMTIYEWNKCSKALRYVAYTRSNNIKNINIIN